MRNIDLRKARTFSQSPIETRSHGNCRIKTFLSTTKWMKQSLLILSFITSDNGVTQGYNNASVSVVHFYRDVTFPAGETAINLSFDWQALGETNFWDGLIVSLAPTSYTPTASGTSLAQGNLGSPTIELGRFWGSSTVQNVNIMIPASVAGNCSGATPE